MSLITDFIAIFGIHQTIKSARKDDLKHQLHYTNEFDDHDVYCNLDVEDIYNEELDDIIDEEWD